MHKYNQYVTEIGDLAVRALVYELATTPKPGLVDKENNGAHTDMDYGMFKKSAMSLRRCFEQCALAGIEDSLMKACGKPLGTSSEPIELKLRKIGLAGEREMFRTTGGVNTHKGLVFSLGIICGACGTLLIGEGGKLEFVKPVEGMFKFSAEKLQARCAEISRRVLEINNAPLNTHGTQVYAKTGVYGVRGEALSGFNTSFKYGLPSLRKALAEGHSGNDAMVIALLNLMTVSEDSNVVYRGGIQGLEYVKAEAGRILDEHTKDGLIEEVRKFDAECIKKNLSPGGSADLLAVTAMLHMILE